MPKQLLAFLLLTLLSVRASAQDTLRLMQYNLTNYGNYFVDCTTTNNNVNTKDAHLGVILNYIRPDILGVNEMYRSDATAGRITTILNNLGYGTFVKPNIINLANSALVNTLYYNTDKLVLKKHTGINSTVRTIDHFVLYYKAADLATNPDTAFLNILVCHLKAGNTAADATTRGQMADAVISYLNSIKAKGAFIMQGDFNSYSNAEACMTKLTTQTIRPSMRLVDPLNKMGAWSNNSAFQNVHTQSSITGGSTCLSGGGLDDRFDFIFANNYLLNDSNGVTFINGTYKAVGNNGGLFNNAVNATSNSAAPTNVLNALAGNSDHLPVRVDIRINRPVIVSVKSTQKVASANALFNPSTNQILITIDQPELLIGAYCKVFNQAGQLVKTESFNNASDLTIDATGLSRGMYHLEFLGPRQLIKPTKLLVW